MREDYFDLKNLEATQKEILSRFFPEYVTERMNDWQKSSWLDIMHRSRFGKLTERSVSELVMIQKETICTTLLAVYKSALHLYISDGKEVSKIRVDLFNGFGLERLRQKLHSFLLPAAVEPGKFEEQRRRLLLNTLERCFEEPTFILA